MQGAPAMHTRAADHGGLEGRERLLEVAICDGDALGAVIDRLEALVAGHRPFALLVTGSPDLESWQRMLWQAPASRARLRRIRSALGTWCAGTAHLVETQGDGALAAAERRFAELCWGCRAEPFTDRAAAVAWLTARLEDR